MRNKIRCCTRLIWNWNFVTFQYSEFWFVEIFVKLTENKSTMDVIQKCAHFTWPPRRESCISEHKMQLALNSKWLEIPECVLWILASQLIVSRRLTKLLGLEQRTTIPFIPGGSLLPASSLNIHSSFKYLDFIDFLQKISKHLQMILRCKVSSLDYFTGSTTVATEVDNIFHFKFMNQNFITSCSLEVTLSCYQSFCYIIIENCEKKNIHWAYEAVFISSRIIYHYSLMCFTNNWFTE
jgi:hypothetical protein